MENIYAKDMSHLCDAASRQIAERLVLRCGIRADLKGFDYLVDATILSGVGCCSHICKIYSLVGEFRSAKQKSVMRDIKYALDNALGLADRLGAMLGIAIAATDIHNALVISYLGKLFASHALFESA